MEIKFHPRFWNSFEKCFSNDLRYLIPRKINDWRHELKWAWQRVFKGYDDRITWSLCDWLDDNLPKILREMKSFAHGTPQSMSLKQWKDILEKIAEGFDASRQLSNCDYMRKVKTDKPIKDIFGIKHNYKWEVDNQKKKKMEDSFNYGMKLFVKHYHSFWD